MSLATVATLGRFVLRWRHHIRLRWDDFFNALALACFIATAAGDHIVDLMDGTTAMFLRLELASYLFLWATLYSVKASFLALCWSIFQVSRSFRKAWWIITVYTFLTCWPIALGEFLQCGSFSDYDNPTVCNGTVNGTVNSTMASFKIVNAVLHSSSDFLILALTFFYIKGLHLSRFKKISVATTFGIIIIDILIGTIRNVASALAWYGYNADVMSQMDFAMQAFEPGIAVILCTFPAYRVLLPKPRGQRRSPVRLQHDIAPVGYAVPRENRSIHTLQTETPEEKPETATAMV